MIQPSESASSSAAPPANDDSPLSLQLPGNNGQRRSSVAGARRSIQKKSRSNNHHWAFILLLTFFGGQLLRAFFWKFDENDGSAAATVSSSILNVTSVKQEEENSSRKKKTTSSELPSSSSQVSFYPRYHHAFQVNSMKNEKQQQQQISTAYDRYWLAILHHSHWVNITAKASTRKTGLTTTTTPTRRTTVAIHWLPKVMSSSIRAHVAAQECPGEAEQSQCHHAFGCFAHSPARTRNLQNANITRVLLVRDPLARALSAYQNSPTNRFISAGRRCPDATRCSLDEWLDVVGKRLLPRAYANARRNKGGPSSIPNIAIVQHFLPQTYLAQMNTLHYHYVLRMSSAVDQHFFWNVLLGAPTIPWHNHHRHGNRNNPNPENNDSNGTMASTITNQALIAKAKIRRKVQNNNMTPRVFAQLSHMYRHDIALWEQLLREETPPQASEYGLYDYWKEEIKGK